MIYVYRIVVYKVYDFFSIQMILVIVPLFANVLSLSCWHFLISYNSVYLNFLGIFGGFYSQT